MDVEDVPVVGAGRGYPSSPRDSAVCSSATKDTHEALFCFLIKAKQMTDMLHFSGPSLYCQKFFSFSLGTR